MLLTATSLQFTGIHDVLLTAIILNTPNVHRVKVKLDSKIARWFQAPVPIPRHVDTLISLQSLDITGTGICPLHLFYILERAPQLRHLHALFDSLHNDADLHPASVSLPHLETVSGIALPLLLPLAP